ncbi:MAG: WD40 repeat protein/energy-coupling factor transporter ATP-binding protein EcfA2 [Candidatus Promineifilaceae bacterium]|jgi:WD40 repeat protein/energy-coupling factor transporter ATP-binding protein EcfA2
MGFEFFEPMTTPTASPPTKPFVRAFKMSNFNPTQRQIWRRILRESLNLEDVKSISFDLEVEYEDLAGDTKTEKINSLLDTLFRENRLETFRTYLVKNDDYNHVALPGLGELVGKTPYVGLSAFSEESAKNFFGREAFVTQLQEAVEKQPFVPVLGPSGSGKSSLIFAGLFPKIRPMPDWMVLNTRPGADITPLHSLITAFLSPALQGHLPHSRRKVINEIAGQVLAGELTLMDLVTDLAQQNQEVKNILLYVDQFEELFTADQEADHTKTNQFLDHIIPLVKTASTQVRLVVLITMRADFLGYALGHPALADLLNHHEDVKLRPLKVDRDPDKEDELSEMERVIVLPARNAGASFQDGVVERIIEDVGDGPGNLPLLQFALTELWNVQENGILTHQGYDFIGQADGALINHAEAVFADLSMAEQKQARDLFTQLVQPGRGTTDTRRITTRGELADEVWQLAQKLSGEETRLVIAGSDGDQRETVQVTHEALIANWNRLKNWMDEDRAFREWQEQFRADVTLWFESSESTDYLYQGARLAQSQEQIRIRLPNLQTREQHFIEKSQYQAEAELREAEEYHQQELKQAKALAEAQENELVAQKKRSQITTVALGAITLMLVASVWAGILAFRNGEAARVQKTKAQTQALLSLSTTTLPEHISPSVPQAEQAILMGIQAVRNDANNEKELLSPSFVNQQLRTLMTELERPAWSELPIGDTSGFPSGLPNFNQVQISADGQFAIAPESSGNVYLWDLNTLEQYPITFTIDFNSDQYDFEDRAAIDYYRISAVIASDSSFIVTQYGETDIGLWWTDDQREPFNILSGHDTLISRIALSTDSRNLATVSADGKILLWNLDELITVNTPFLTLQAESDVTGISFSPDGRYLITGQGDGRALGWDISGGGATELFEYTFDSSIESIAVSPDGSLLAIGNDDGVYLQPLNDPQAMRQSASRQATVIYDVAFSYNGKTLASVSDDKSILLWDTSNLNLEPMLLAGHTSLAKGAAFSPDGSVLISVGDNSAPLIWDLKQQKTSTQILPVSDWVHQVDWSPDGGHIAAGLRDGTAVLIDSQTGEILQTLSVSSEFRTGDLLYSPDGKWLATVSEDENIRLWKAGANYRLARELTLTRDQEELPAISVAFSPDSRLIASSAEGVLYVWEVEDVNATVRTFADEELAPEVLEFSADGSKIATVDEGFNIQIRDSDQLDQVLNTLTGHTNYIQALAFSADGNWLASGGDDSLILVWDLNNLDKEPRKLEDHQSFVWSLDFSPDSQLLLSGSDDNTVRIWNMSDLSAESQLLEGHTAFVWSAEFSPDGRYIASGSSDKTVRIWPTLDTLVELACDRVTRNMTQTEWDQFLLGQTYVQTCPNRPPHPSTQ